MLTPVCYITIGNFKFKGCKSFDIDKDVENLSVTGTIEMPLMAMMNIQDGKKAIAIDKSIKAGDTIKVEAGYLEHEIKTIFMGFIRNIDTSTTIKIKVEDAIYQYRKQPVLMDLKSISVKDLLVKLSKGTGCNVSDKTANIIVDVFKYKGNAAGALAKLKEALNLTIYVDNNELYAGGQQLNPKGQIKVIYSRNIISNKTSYEYKETNPVLVEVIGKNEDGTEVKVVAGIDGGSKMTFHKYNVSNEKALKIMANELLNKYSFDGFKGGFELFFIPFAEPGGSVKYTNENYQQETEGIYFIKGVKYSFGSQRGLRQQIELGAKL